MRHRSRENERTQCSCWPDRVSGDKAAGRLRDGDAAGHNPRVPAKPATGLRFRPETFSSANSNFQSLRVKLVKLNATRSAKFRLHRSNASKCASHEGSVVEALPE